MGDLGFAAVHEERLHGQQRAPPLSATGNSITRLGERGSTLLRTRIADNASFKVALRHRRGALVEPLWCPYGACVGQKLLLHKYLHAQAQTKKYI